MNFIRTTLFFFLAICLFSCSRKSPKNVSDSNTTTHIRVGAYNVEYSKNATAEEIGNALNSYDFDVVCFSEAPGGDWSKNVGKAMGLNYQVVGKYSTAGHKDKYKTIVSKTPLYDYKEVLMADTLHTATKAKMKIAGTEFSIYAVHFPFGWRSQAHIDSTTHKIKTFIDYVGSNQNSEISIVAGDFNFIPSNSEKKNMYYEMFREIGMDNAWKALGVDCTKRNTWNAMNPKDDNNGEVIDHVMFNTSKMVVIDGGIIEMENPLSDHKPVWAELKIK